MERKCSPYMSEQDDGLWVCIISFNPSPRVKYITASYIYFVSNPKLHYVTGSEKTGHFTNDFKAVLLLQGCSIDLGQ